MRAAAEAGEPQAMTRLGNMLYNRGQKAEGEQWWLRAAQ